LSYGIYFSVAHRRTILFGNGHICQQVHRFPHNQLLTLRLPHQRPAAANRVRHSLEFPSNAYLTGLDDHKSPRNLFAMLCYEAIHSLPKGAAGVSRETNQENSRTPKVADIHQPAEVLILRQKNPVFAVGLLNESAVVRPGSDFTDSEDITPL